MMERAPLYGCKIVVTRSRHQATDLAGLLEVEGATVFRIPAIEIVEREHGILQLKNRLDRIQEFGWVLLTSVNSVRILHRLLKESNKDWSHLSPVRIGCIGAVTAQKVEQLGGTVSLIPPTFRAESLATEISKNDLSGIKILLPRAAGSRPVLPVELERAGAIVEEIHIYSAELPDESKHDFMLIFQQNKIDFLTFTSSSTVRNFAEIAGGTPWQTIPVACIGPITAQTLREYGVEPAVEADEYTIRGLVDALKSKVGKQRRQ